MLYLKLITYQTFKKVVVVVDSVVLSHFKPYTDQV